LQHIEVGVYFLRKKYCYHLPSYPKSKCAVTNLLFDQYMTKLASVHPSDEQKKKIRIRKRMEEKKNGREKEQIKKKAGCQKT